MKKCKLQYVGEIVLHPKPSPLGKVAERSEDGRGLSRQPFGLPPSPLGRAFFLFVMHMACQFSDWEILEN